MRELAADVRVGAALVAGQHRRARPINVSHAGFKTLVEDGTQRILGAHLLAPHADEVINLFGLAMRNGLPASALKELPRAYPTSASDVAYML